MGLNFHVVFCQNRKKFDKYAKINRVRNKVVIDIKAVIEEEDIRLEEYRQYFNLLVYTRIVHSLKRGRDIYYIPNFASETFDVDHVHKMRSILPEGVGFNALIFFDDFKGDERLEGAVTSGFDVFDAVQIIKDY